MFFTKRVIFMFFAIWSFPVSAVNNYFYYPMSELELSMLPPFCQAWGKKDVATTDAWVEKLKIPNIHHLCKGLNHVNHTVIDMKQEDIRHNAAAGIGEFTYVLDFETKLGHRSFPLKAFVLTNRAKLYGISGDNEKALNDFTAALKENPKYDKIYYELSAFYINNNKKDKAKEVIEDGLRHIPESKLLNKFTSALLKK